METFDCIVVGCGGFGSGALYHAAKRGARVLGIEQHTAAHDLGSSHGESRIIRKAYFEHPNYVPLLHDAFDLWRLLQEETGTTLLHECGLFIAGPADGLPISGTRRAASEHALPIESIPAAKVGGSFDGFHIPESCDIVVEPDAGVLLVEDCVRAHLQQAQSLGAVLKTGETVTGWKANGRTIIVQTNRREYSAASVIFTAGAWTQSVLQELNIPLQVVRKFTFWHPCDNTAFTLANNARVFFFDLPEGEFYGVPSIDGRTIKLGRHTGGMNIDDPSQLDRQYQDADHAAVSDFVRRHMDRVDPQPVRHSACMYTFTADGHFVVDQHPHHKNVVIGAGFSGHGFKFTGVLGRSLADLALDGKTDSPIEFLNCERLLRV